MQPIKVAILGCGRIAQRVHLNNLKALPQVSVVALAEPDDSLRQQAGNQFPAAALYSSYEELLNQAQAEAAIICLPSHLHAAAAEGVISRGWHLYMEKPLATNRADGLRVLMAGENAPTTLMVGYNYRFSLLYRSLKQHLESGRYGQVQLARSVFSSGVAASAWKKSRESGGGVLLDLAVHHIDLARYLFQTEIVKVQAQLQSRKAEADTAFVTLNLANGLCLQSVFTNASAPEDRFEIYAERGTVTLDRLGKQLIESDSITYSSRLGRLRRTLRAWSSPYFFDSILAPSREPSYQAALSHFVECARSGQPTRPNLQDGYRSLIVALAAEESARTGQAVTVDISENIAGT